MAELVQSRKNNRTVRNRTSASRKVHVPPRLINTRDISRKRRWKLVQRLPEEGRVGEEAIMGGWWLGP